MRSLDQHFRSDVLHLRSLRLPEVYELAKGSMHPHLHTKENAACEELIAALDACHARGFFWKAIGTCNDVKRDLTRCLRAERIERTRKNRETALAQRTEVKKLFKEIDENS